jgi:hypothetical protein
VARNVAKIIIKMSIYPSKEEICGATEAYLKKNHSEFFEKFTDAHWVAYYNENFHKNVNSFWMIFIRYIQ